jgi:hypothetical protein
MPGLRPEPKGCMARSDEVGTSGAPGDGREADLSTIEDYGPVFAGVAGQNVIVTPTVSE